MLLLLLWRPPAPAAAITHFPACCFAPLPLPPCLPACPPCIILLPPPLPQNHSNEDIYEKAVALLEHYFDVEDGEVENLAPAVDAAAGTYAFGAGAGVGAPPAGGFNFGMQQ